MNEIQKTSMNFSAFLFQGSAREYSLVQGHRFWSGSKVRHDKPNNMQYILKTTLYTSQSYDDIPFLPGSLSYNAF